MRVFSSLFALILFAWIPSAFGLECFSIQDADQRNACLASAKRDKSYCFKIQHAAQIAGRGSRA